MLTKMFKSTTIEKLEEVKTISIMERRVNKRGNVIIT
jgi:hypothetical protein